MVTQLVKDYFVQKALDSNLNNSINEFYEFRNFMNTWSQEDNNYTNLLLTGYECKPVKNMHFIKRRILPEAEFVFVRGLLLLTYWQDSKRSHCLRGKAFWIHKQPE